MLHDDSFDFSFSGLKTAVVNLLKKLEREGIELSVPDLAAEFQDAVVDVLARKTMRAAEESHAASVLLCGGVAANTALRQRLEREASRSGLPFFCPDFALCTDNAAMVACAGYHNFIHRSDKLPLSPQPNISL
jgi:N6-L-threonylcarbamoyladenine synthase